MTFGSGILHKLKADHQSSGTSPSVTDAIDTSGAGSYALALILPNCYPVEAWDHVADSVTNTYSQYGSTLTWYGGAIAFRIMYSSDATLSATHTASLYKASGYEAQESNHGFLVIPDAGAIVKAPQTPNSDSGSITPAAAGNLLIAVWMPESYTSGETMTVEDHTAWSMLEYTSVGADSLDIAVATRLAADTSSHTVTFSSTGYTGSSGTVVIIEVEPGGPPPSVSLSGTVTTATESDIVTGGETIVLTLSNTTWLASS